MDLLLFASKGHGHRSRLAYEPSARTSFVRVILGQLGPASKPLILSGNLSVAGIDLRPTRVDRRVRRMVAHVARKRDDVSIKLPYNPAESYMQKARLRGKINHDKCRLERARSDDYLCPSFTNRRLVDR